MKTLLLHPRPATVLIAVVLGLVPTAPRAAGGEADRDRSEVIPLIVMDDVPLDVAIANLARQAQLKVVLDPKLSNPSVGPDGRIVARPVVSIRWQKITAKQALVALLDNYDLVMVGDPAMTADRITIKEQADTKAAPPEKGVKKEGQP